MSTDGYLVLSRRVVGVEDVDVRRDAAYEGGDIGAIFVGEKELT